MARVLVQAKFNLLLVIGLALPGRNCKATHRWLHAFGGPGGVWERTCELRVAATNSVLEQLSKRLRAPQGLPLSAACMAQPLQKLPKVHEFSRAGSQGVTWCEGCSPI